MRKSKTRKSDLKQARLNHHKNKKKEKEAKLKAQEDRDEKYQEWLDLPQDKWTDARKKKNGIAVDEVVETTEETKEETND